MGKIKEMTTTILQIAPIKTKIFQGIITCLRYLIDY